MEALTSLEQKIFNYLSQVRDPDIKLGDIIQNIISAMDNLVGEPGADGITIVAGTPVNAANAGETLTISGVAKAGETVTIGDDVYEFTADANDTVSAEGNIAVDIEASTVKSSGTLTMDTQPTSGDTITIGEKTYIFVPVGTDNADGEVSIGDDLAGAKLALVAAINGADDHNTAHPLVTAAAFGVADTCVITAIVGGTAGDGIDTAETFTAGSNIFAAAKLAGGSDCSAANAVTALVGTITLEDTQGVSAADGDGNTVVLTADVAGVIGNEIGVSTDMALGAFTAEAVALSGGIDGTVADALTILADASYIYICVLPNTVADKNWRRIALGNVF